MIAAVGFVLGVVLVFTGPPRDGEFIALGSFIAVLFINRRYAERDTWQLARAYPPELARYRSFGQGES